MTHRPAFPPDGSSPAGELEALVLELIAATLELDAATLSLQGDAVVAQVGPNRADRLCGRGDPFYRTHEAAALAHLALRRAAARPDD